jgi:hypothetical protein
MTAYRHGKAQAWAVWGFSKWRPDAKIDILGSDSIALEAVTSAAIKRAKEAGVPYLRAVTNEESAIRALRSCGFIKRRALPLIVRSMTARNLDGNIHDHSSWRIYTADLDTF